jgi:excisionase family DNA binding protein
MSNPTLVHTIAEVCARACIGRTALYEEINSGALRAVKRGKRTLVLDEDLHAWLQALPPITVREQAPTNEGRNLQETALRADAAVSEFAKATGECGGVNLERDRVSSRRASSRPATSGRASK